MLWALAIMGFKLGLLMTERKLLDADLISVAEGMTILPRDTRELERQIETLNEKERKMVLPRALLNALRRFGATKNVQDVSVSTHTIFESESERLESELSMIRYISWAIPSIGFIGTVRGIGEALGQADIAVQGDISRSNTKSRCCLQFDLYCSINQYFFNVFGLSASIDARDWYLIVKIIQMIT